MEVILENYERIYTEIISEDSGLWFVSDNIGIKIIVKLPSSTIKSIINGCQFNFIFGKERINSNIYFHNCIRVYDDLVNYLEITAPQIYFEDHKALLDIMNIEKVPIEFYNELDFLLAGSIIIFSENFREKVKLFLGDIKSLYVGNYTNEVKKSLDNFDYTLDRGRVFSEVKNIETIKIGGNLEKINVINVHVIGDNRNFLIQINEINEGELQERLVWSSLSSLFGAKIYKGALIKNKDVFREFTDVFTFDSNVAFLIESKCLSLFKNENEKSMERKVLTIQKHIRKAISQLVGASKEIKRGESIFNYESKNEINYEKEIHYIHCIILISDIYPFGDWSHIIDEIINTINKENIFLNILDLKELIKFIKFSSGKIYILDKFLKQRCEIVCKTRDPFIVAKLGV